MDYSANERVYIWLDSFPLDLGEKLRLLKEAGTPAALTRNFERFRESLIKSAGESVYNNMSASLTDGGKYFRKLADVMDREGIVAIAKTSPLYPKSFLSLSDAPLVVYAKGNVSLLNTRMFTVVGSRRTPPAALKLGTEICKELSEAFTLVTGTADGGDSAAIEGALSGEGKAICVLAGGFSAVPQGNFRKLEQVAERGLLLSVNSYDTPVRTYSYERRNKLLAALGEGVFVLGAGEKSGALITARYANAAKKPIFAIPYPPNAAAGVGCNRLIKKGGFLVENSFDILGYFGINLVKEKNRVSLTSEEETVLNGLRELTEAHVSELAAKTGIPAYKLSAILSSLEIKGGAVKLGGNRYAPV